MADPLLWGLIIADAVLLLIAVVCSINRRWWSKG